jgi:acylphosphatase
VQVRGFRATVRGRVHGVGFRYFVLRQAEMLGVRGYARNLPDGAVEVVAAGDAGSLEHLAESLRQGPSAARVESLERTELEIVPEFDGFEIRT